jgi:hypothetical protein
MLVILFTGKVAFPGHLPTMLPASGEWVCQLLSVAVPLIPDPGIWYSFDSFGDVPSTEICNLVLWAGG